jgi:hypothetical protein
MPTVHEENPTNQNSFRQYTFLIHGKCCRLSQLVFALIFPIIADTAYFDRITAITWT